MHQPAEIWIRLGGFLSVLAIMNLWEWLSPRRNWHVPKFRRLLSNYLLVVLNAVLLRYLLPLSCDRVVRQAIVTPDMHRVHHSVLPRETNSNYGFNLSGWDRFFGTYRDQPEQGHHAMEIGLPEYQSEAIADRLIPMLEMPFRKIQNEPKTTEP